MQRTTPYSETGCLCAYVKGQGVTYCVRSHKKHCSQPLDWKKEVDYRGADKSLARPGRKQATATKLLQATQKKNSDSSPSNQVTVAAMTSASDEKWRPFNCFFSRVGLRNYQHPCT